MSDSKQVFQDSLDPPIPAEDSFIVSLFGSEKSILEGVLSERIALHGVVADRFAHELDRLRLTGTTLDDLWRTYLPLAQYLVRRRDGGERCCLAAIVGAPGSGKTTLARFLALILRWGYGVKTVSFSSDDFYLPKSERAARGQAWRGPPETHDQEALADVLADLRGRRSISRLPRFDPGRDDRTGFEAIAGPLSFCFFEGWMTARLIDDLPDGSAETLLYLDAPLGFLKEARLDKEAVLRAAGRGLSARDMETFWNDIIEPGIRDFVEPYRARADLILTMGENHAVKGVTAPADQ